MAACPLRNWAEPGDPPETAAVALSGGRDSLLALAMLREAGWRVIGLHGRFHQEEPGTADGLRRLCGDLRVELRVVDLRQAFHERIVAPFIREYLNGRTPNPCCRCNRSVKFGLLLDEARALGADRLATGHYARMAEGPHGRPLLARGADPSREQSYFLSLVDPSSLPRVLFPLGELCKAEVDGMLAERRLAPVVQRESREVCFVPGDDYKAFLASRADELPGPGPIRLADGREVGRHRGLWRHTIGQRRGLGVAWSEPLYVLEKRVLDNVLIVGPKADLACSGFTAREPVYHLDPAFWPDELWVQGRYRQRANQARVHVEENGFSVSLLTPRSPPAPGQIAAVYDEAGLVLAGGVVDELALAGTAG
ncbi:tRNA 2-thiouridine(34) synthase MnmA [Desulfohalovibrio reitneri]|uniref:tRNA 2-thiouridine(34) synthase MnmA n=1 Tax=Desulfohalovibrio reitneri TaxID=1307759 RepID=UPI0009DF71F8|nr:tRNA 2-thiouridine(34) synthase MnmA [Desulfohalovibrio reitneri]